MDCNSDLEICDNCASPFSNVHGQEQTSYDSLVVLDFPNRVEYGTYPIEFMSPTLQDKETMKSSIKGQ